MSTSTRRLRWILLALPVFLMAFVACETAAPASTPIPTPTPTSTPTPTPIPLLSPILVDPDDDPKAFFQLMPEDEQQCLTQSLGQARLDDILGGAGFAEEDDRVMEQCISQGTYARIMLGSFVNQVSDLSDDTMSCVWNTLREVDLKRLFTSDDDEAQVLAFQTILSTSLCLTDDEAARAEVSAGTEEFPLAGMRCLAELVDAESLATIFSADQGLPPLEIIVAMLECGIEIFGTEGEGLQHDEQQLACLREILDAEDLAQFFDQEGGLPFETITAMLECGIEILGTEGTGDSGFDFSAEDLACVVEALGEEAMTEMVAGERLPTFGEILALAGCDLDFEGLLSGS